ncbi:hypothetical protein GMA11_03315 [Granulicatella sp. zg-ZJ]|uniref:ABC transporter permease n=1 Tax=Granulicatella sp. zg-ZJ TaxID=2678504 RepID=UPI0013D02174|nr:hypothetical protein [Granulicatella sp. zg-ZJ]NEW62417.1 hypothetical protein [Granulicatella sp. zg-ZJ]
MRKNLFILSAILHRRNKVLWTIITALAISIATLFCVCVLSNSYLKTIQKEKEAIYGGFSHIIYKENTIKKDIPFGIMTVGHIQNEKEEKNLIAIGSMNEKANAVSLRKENVIHLKPHHTILTESLANLYHVKENDTFQLANQTWTVEDVIKDYGQFWIRGKEEESRQYTPPQMIISSEDLNALITSKIFLSVYSIVLNHPTFFPTNNLAFFNIEGAQYRNDAIDVFRERHYGFSENFNIILLTVVIFVTIVLLYTYKKSITERYRIYALLGQTKLNHLYQLEISLLVGCVGIISIVLSLLSSCLLASLSYQKLTFPDTTIFFSEGIRYIIAYFLSFILFLIMNPYIDKAHKKGKAFKTKIPLSKKVPIYIGTVFIFTSAIMLLLTNFFLYYYETDTANHQTIVGRMAQQFDYEVQPVPTIRDTSIKQAFYDGKWHDNKGKEGVYLSDLHQQNLLYDVQKSLTSKSIQTKNNKFYIESNQTYLFANQELLQQPYIQEKHRRYVNEQKILSRLFETEYLLNIQLTAYPEEDLKWLAQETGQNDTLHDVLSGEKAWIIAIPYTVQSLSDDVSVSKQFKLSSMQDPNNIHDTVLSTGKPQTIGILESCKTSAYGYFTEEDIQKFFTVKKIDVSIAGIIYQNIGWFDAYEKGGAYRFVVSNNFFEKHHLKNTPTRYRFSLINTENSLEHEKVKQVISSYGNIDLLDKTSTQKILTQYDRMQNGFKVLLLSVFIILSVAMMYSFIQAYLLDSHDLFSIYLLLGYSTNKLYKKAIIPLILSILSAFLFTTISVSVFFFDTEFYLNLTSKLPVYVVYLGIFYGTYLCLFITVFYVLIKKYGKQVYQDSIDRT